MQQTIFARQEFNECTVRHDRTYFTFIYFSDLRYGNNTFDHTHCVVNRFFVSACNLDTAYTVYLFDGDSSTGILLHSLNNLSARADDGSDEFFRNSHGLDTWSMVFQFGTWFFNGFMYLAEDVHTAFFCLFQCAFENVEWQTVYFDIHLGSSDTVFGSGNFEVHISQVVLVT